MALDWQGDKLTKKMDRAQVRGINATMAAAVVRSKRSFINAPRGSPAHPRRLTVRTAVLQGSIDTVERARRQRGGVSGVWGSQDVRYALIHELGGQAGRGRASTIPPRPYLRPAADTEYPRLAGLIKRAFR